MRFGKHKQRGPAIDPSQGDPGAARLRETLAAQDWAGARDVLEATPHPDDRAFYLDVAGTVQGVQDWIGEWAGKDPLAQLVRGCHAVRWAWEARGAYQAEFTAEDQFKLFFERLRVAESCLYDATERLPDEAASWAFLVTTARGLQLPVEDASHRFGQAVERHPGHQLAHDEMLQTLCEKWSGSHRQMHAFAVEAVEKSPQGSMMAHLLAMAHLEVAIDLEGPVQGEYLRRTDVRDSLHQAAQRSIFSPEAQFRPGWPRYANSFAVAFSLADDLPAAAAAFDVIGDLVTLQPWGYLGGDESEKFAEARDRAYAARG